MVSYERIWAKIKVNFVEIRIHLDPGTGVGDVDMVPSLDSP